MPGTPPTTLPHSGSVAALTNVALTPVVAEKPFISIEPRTGRTHGTLHHRVPLRVTSVHGWQFVDLRILLGFSFWKSRNIDTYQCLGNLECATHHPNSFRLDESIPKLQYELFYSFYHILSFYIILTSYPRIAAIATERIFRERIPKPATSGAGFLDGLFLLGFCQGWPQLPGGRRYHCGALQ